LGSAWISDLLADFLQRVVCAMLATPPDWLRVTHHADAEAVTRVNRVTLVLSVSAA